MQHQSALKVYHCIRISAITKFVTSLL